MRRIIENGSIIQLESNGQRVEFIVNDKLGIGGSCIAYSVTYYENGTIPHKGVLKEYCPAFLESSSEFQRNGDTLIIPIELKERFNRGLEIFETNYKIINDYISSNSIAMNYHPVQIGLFSGNNTLYTLSSADYGKSYDTLQDESLASLIRIMIAVAEAVKQYHNAGYLHLDIKPKNILVLNNVTEIVKLFDYDSLTPITLLKSNKSVALPMPEDYYVPELNQQRLRDIGIQTDLFEIGAMLFMRLFGYAPQPSDLSYDAIYDIEKSKLLEAASPSAIYEITQLLKHTLLVSSRRRYRSDEELINQLKKVFGMVSSEKPFLMNLPVWKPSKHCIERKAEIQEIDERLNTDGFVFIRGIGGIGKSELVKIYVNKYGFKYHTIQFCKYVDSLKGLVASLAIDGVDENDYNSIDSLAKTKNRILHNCDSHTLIVVDNFNVPHDNYLREFLPTNSNSFKVIITTRCVPAADYYEEKIMRLSTLEEEDAIKLFYMHSNEQVSSETTHSIRQLLKEIQFNTLLLVLIAKMIKMTSTSIEKMIGLLKDQQLDTVSTRVFHEYDCSDDIETYNKISKHLYAVYNTSNLTIEEIRTLLNMTLISPIGIEVNSFVKNTGNNSMTYDCIYNLIRLGWIEIKGNMISLHSIISDVVADNYQDRTDSYYELCDFLESQCYVDYDQHISEIQNALAIALQLDKRYKDEDPSLIANISFIIAMINSYLYKPKEARRLFEKAIQIEEKENDYEALTILYSQMGPFEEKFGTKTVAIYWYKKTIETAGKTQVAFTEEICSSILGIAQCYDENNQKPLALQKYIEAFEFMEKRGFLEYVRGVLERIIELLAELKQYQDIDYYAAKLNQYGGRRFSDEKHPIDVMIDSGNYDEAKHEYEKLLEEIRGELGEDSPTYRDYAKYRWVYYLLTNDKDQAMRLIADDLSFIENSYGKESMEMADFLVSLSYQMTDNAEFEYAMETAERAIAICRSNRQIGSYTFTKAKMDLVFAFAVLGEYDKAQSIIDEIDFSQFSGDEFLSDMVRTVGMALVEIGENKICIQLCEEALSKSGIDKISKLIAAEIMLVFHDKRGNTDAAEGYLNIIKSIIDSLSDSEYAKNHIVTYRRLTAKLMSKKSNYDDAIREVSSAIDLIPDGSSLILLQCYIERGLYYINIEKVEEAEKDYLICERIIKRYGLSDYYFIIVYNNVALAKIQADDFESAKEYYERILERLPDVRNPENYNEATICQNYGWVLYNLEEVEKGREYIRASLDYYDREGFGTSIDFYSSLYNLLIINNSLDDFEGNMVVAKRLYQDYSIIECLRECEASFRISIACAIVSGYLSIENENTAYEFANEEEGYYIKKYGKKSQERIDYLQTCAYAFYRLMYLDAFEFLERSEKVIQKARLQSSVWEARQLNYVGIVYLDLTDEIELGNKYIKDSKALFEELGAEDDYMYPIVVKNAKYAQEKIMDKLISDMAKSFIDEKEENNG